jgi:hypothetical protein
MVLFTKYNEVDNIKENEMGRHAAHMVEMEMHTKLLVGKPERKRQL